MHPNHYVSEILQLENKDVHYLDDIDDRDTTGHKCRSYKMSAFLESNKTVEKEK